MVQCVCLLCLLCVVIIAAQQAATASANLVEPPDYYIIGVQKCGTTSVFAMITTHPELCKGRNKEPHFFDMRYDLGPTYWTEYFTNTSCKGHNVDATPDYFSSPEAPIRMYQTFPPETRDRKRFVVILRDPVARMYSWYDHNINFCVGIYMKRFFKDMKHANRVMPSTGWDIRETKLTKERHCQYLQVGTVSRFLKPGKELEAIASFAQFSDTPAAHESTGHYSSSLAHWLTHFRRNQILILNFENVVDNPGAAANAIAAFYNLSHGFPKDIKLTHKNAPQIPSVLDCATRDKLAKRYAEHVADLYDYMERTPAADKPPMEPPFGRFNHAAKCT